MCFVLRQSQLIQGIAWDGNIVISVIYQFVE